MSKQLKKIFRLQMPGDTEIEEILRDWPPLVPSLPPDKRGPTVNVWVHAHRVHIFGVAHK